MLKARPAPGYVVKYVRGARCFALLLPNGQNEGTRFANKRAAWVKSWVLWEAEPK